MKTRKIGVVLLAFLLAAMTMVPMVSAENSLVNSDVQSIYLKNQTITISGITLPDANSTSHSFDYAKFSTPLTREEFMSYNKEYLDFLSQKIGRDAAIKMQNDEYTKLITAYNKQKTAQNNLIEAVTPTIRQIWGADIFLWPWESQIKSTTDPNANPMTFVVIGNSQYTLKNYLLSHGWNNALGYTEWGLSGSSLASVSWHYVTSYNQVEKGDYFGTRNHALIHPGTYSTSYGKWWSYGECHTEIWNGFGHNILTNGFDSGENEISLTLSGAYSRYSNYMNNAVLNLFNGAGHIFYI